MSLITEARSCEPRHAYISNRYHPAQTPHMALVFAAQGVRETLNTLESADRYAPPGVGVVAVAQAPEGMREFVDGIADIDPYVRDHLLDDYLIRSPVPKSAIGGGHTRATIFVEKEHMNGVTVADMVRRLKPQQVSVISNNNYGLERLVAETGDALSPEFDLHVTPLKAHETLASKYRTAQMQQELGLFVPPITLVSATDHSGEKKDGREIKEDILRNIHFIGFQNRGDVIIKPDSAFGSEKFYKLSHDMTRDEKEEVVTEYLQDFGSEQSADTVVQGFVRGIDVGAFITVSEGKIHIDYTRKTMAKGRDGRRSEEVQHAFDPDDPINLLCETVLTPKLKRIIQHLGLENSNQAYNADAILDERYFDNLTEGNVTTYEEIENDKSFVIEINDRQGGEGMTRFWSQAYGGKTYDGAIVGANLGDSLMIYEMNSSTPIKPAVMHTIFHGYRGPVLKPAYPGHIHRMYGVFYVSSATQLAIQNGDAMTITQHQQTLEEIQDWKTKGDRLVIGVSAKDMRTTKSILNTSLGALGMLGLSEKGTVHYDAGQGKLVENPVDPESPFGKILQAPPYNCIFKHGKWSRP